MERFKTVWKCYDCGIKHEIGHREYRDLECSHCNKTLPKEFISITQAEHDELMKLGCYDKEADENFRKYNSR